MNLVTQKNAKPKKLRTIPRARQHIALTLPRSNAQATCDRPNIETRASLQRVDRGLRWRRLHPHPCSGVISKDSISSQKSQTGGTSRTKNVHPNNADLG